MVTEDKVFHCVQEHPEIFVWQTTSEVFDANDNKIYSKTYREKEISSKFYNVKGRSYADNDPSPRFWLSLLQTFLS